MAILVSCNLPKHSRTFLRTCSYKSLLLLLLSAPVCKGKSKSTLFIQMEEGKETYRKKKQMFEIQTHSSCLVDSGGKADWGFVGSTWKIHSRCYRRQFNIFANFLYVMKLK